MRLQISSRKPKRELLNDCWPVLSWAVLDYYGFGKAGYFYAKRVYAPVLASFKALADDEVELWITNDTLSEVEDSVTVRLGTFDGGTLWEESKSIRVAANSSQAVWRWEADQVAAQPDRYLSVRSAGDAFPFNRHFFAPIKDLQRAPAQPEVSITPVNDHELHVNVRASGAARHHQRQWAGVEHQQAICRAARRRDAVGKHPGCGQHVLFQAADWSAG